MFNKDYFKNYDQVLYIPSFKNGSSLFVYKVFGLLYDEDRKLPDLIITDETDTEFMLECFKNQKINNLDIKNVELVDKIDVTSENKDYGNVYQMIIDVAGEQTPLIVILGSNEETFRQFIYKYDIKAKICCWYVDENVQKDILKDIYLNEFRSFGCESFCVSCSDRDNIFPREYFEFSSSYWDGSEDRYWWLYNYTDHPQTILEFADELIDDGFLEDFDGFDDFDEFDPDAFENIDIEF